VIEAAGVGHGGRRQVPDLRMGHDDGVHSADDQLFTNVQRGFYRIRVHFDGMSVERIARFHERRVEIQMLSTHTQSRALVHDDGTSAYKYGKYY